MNTDLTSTDRIARARQLAAVAEERISIYTDPPVSVLMDLANLHLRIAAEEDRQGMQGQLIDQLQQNAVFAAQLLDEVSDSPTEDSAEADETHELTPQ
jgi:hypothetical protein